MDDLVERVADMLTDWGCGASTDCTSMGAGIIPVVLERAAKAVRSLDFRGEDYAEEDGDKQYLEALDEAEAAIRAIGAKT